VGVEQSKPEGKVCAIAIVANAESKWVGRTLQGSYSKTPNWKLLTGWVQLWLNVTDPQKTQIV